MLAAGLVSPAVLMRFISILTCIALIAPTCATLPSGWRYPAESDYTDDWKSFRSELPIPFHVSADFDGNGASDDAWILLNRSDSRWALFVFLKSPFAATRIIQLSEDGYGEGRAQNYGIALAKPGKHQTACGKGYWKCSGNEPPELDLATPGLVFFKYESASEIYYWDGTARTFRSIAISD